MAEGTIQGASITPELSENDKTQTQVEKTFLLVLKLLSSNKDTRNKCFKISPLEIVSFSSSFLPKAS